MMLTSLVFDPMSKILERTQYSGSGWENPNRWSTRLANPMKGFRILNRSDVENKEIQCH